MANNVKWRMPLDFEDDGASWRVRREQSLREQERRAAAAYVADRVGRNTLRFIAWALIPVAAALGALATGIMIVLGRVALWLAGIR